MCKWEALNKCIYIADEDGVRNMVTVLKIDWQSMYKHLDLISPKSLGAWFLPDSLISAQQFDFCPAVWFLPNSLISAQLGT